ncbi:VCBS repeat-containing protein [Algibacter sp. 2305UL17-15]|uniref:VCBS repeat-containing protein n=1 Tax=Algibacter sp. 2305UL17-15 TaxID=3231268 RepID=UPI003459EE17
MKIHQTKLKMRHLYLIGFICIIFSSSCKDSSDKKETAQINEIKAFNLLSKEQSGIDFKNTIVEETQDMNCFNFFNIYNGGGVAIGDINNDGLSDIFFTGNQVDNALYLNEGDLKFKDITKKAKVSGAKSWTTGVTMVDINADGWLDIYVSMSGSEKSSPSERKNLLYINNKDLTFTESAKTYGIDDSAHTNHAAFFDYDNDGDLDLYTLNHPLGFGDYITTRLEKAKNPKDFETDKLFQNNGNNTFTEVTNEAGIRNYAFGLSVSVADYNNDGWTDIYVANDYSEPDNLYINNKDGTFTDNVHTSMKHISQFSMGSDAGDINNDGLNDLIVVDMMAEDNRRKKTNMQGMNIQAFYTNYQLGRHLQYMQNMLQLNRGQGKFSEIAELSGISNTDWSWSPLFCDLDNDGWKDVYITNGIKRDLRNNDFTKELSKYTRDYIQENHKTLAEKIPSEPVDNYVYKNMGDLNFKKRNAKWKFKYKGYTNGAAYGDLDNDGDLDLVINNLEDTSMVFENKVATANYIKVKLTGAGKNTNAIGAKVTIKTKKGIQFSEMQPTRGFLSSSEPVLHFGLGEVREIDEINVAWINGKHTTLNKVKANQIVEIDQNASENQKSKDNEIVLGFSFTDVTEKAGVRFKHHEQFYEDYDREVLLPQRYSQNGPFISKADVNNDGLDDFFIGGASGQSGVLYIQTTTGRFIESKSQPWKSHKLQEDMGSAFIDVNNDGFLDLYVASGSNEWEENSKNYQDRLYLNDGKGNFTYSANSIPKLTNSGSCVVPFDFDKDGDTDLFVGSRVVPGKYPLTPKSTLLVNNNGILVDKTMDLAPELQNIGMVTDAIWADYDNDSDSDLVITGEWMPITIFENDNGKLSNKYTQTTLQHKTGWWYSITSGDFDNDGDLDFIAGNLGLNSKYQTDDGPLEVYAKDMDNNGTHDIVLGYYENNIAYPLRGKSCSTQQVPSLSSKIPTYDVFGNSSVKDVYGEALEDAFYRKANWFASSYIENRGNNKFKIRALPNYAQFSPINKTIAIDINKDGNLDLITAGNMHSAEIETARHDASYGLVLLGNGKGSFNIEEKLHTLFAEGDVKDMVLIMGKNDTPIILLGQNNAPLKLMTLKK